MRVTSLHIFATLVLLAAGAHGKIKVAASLPNLASIAASVGGEAVEAFAIGRAQADPHAVEVLPSYLIKVSRSAVYLKVGLGLDLWADAILEGSRNGKLLVVDCSRGMAVLEKPHGKVDASHGHVHPDGNPHYWLDPSHAERIADNIREALAKADPSNADLYARNTAAFVKENVEKTKVWAARMAPLQGAALVTYHGSWAYLAHAYGFRIIGQVEPFPGIPPTAKHLAGLVERIRAEKAGLLLQEPYFPDKDTRFLARQTGIRIIKASPSCDGPAAGEHWKHLEALTAALAAPGATAPGPPAIPAERP